MGQVLDGTHHSFSGSTDTPTTHEESPTQATPTESPASHSDHPVVETPNHHTDAVSDFHEPGHTPPQPKPTTTTEPMEMDHSLLHPQGIHTEPANAGVPTGGGGGASNTTTISTIKTVPRLTGFDKKDPRSATAAAATQPLSHGTNRFDTQAWQNYLGLSGRPINPPMIRTALATLKTTFPHAMPNHILMQHVKHILQNYDAKSTLMGSSICPDEVCHGTGDLPHILQAHFGENFHFGGLAGIPFVGKSGFAAFAHHVPEKGNVFIVVAPHMGISHNGTLGQYDRPGQSHSSDTCGAAMGAYKHIAGGGSIPPITDPRYFEDHQLHHIMHRVQLHLKEIQSHPRGVAAGLAEVIFSFAHETMMNSINMDLLNGGTLVVLGGLQINMPKPLEDFFVPMYFQKLARNVPPVDMLSSLVQKT